LRLLHGEGKTGPVLARQRETPTGTALGFDGDTGLEQCLDVPVDCADRRSQTLGELGGRPAAALLEEQEKRDKTPGADSCQIVT